MLHLDIIIIGSVYCFITIPIKINSYNVCCYCVTTNDLMIVQGKINHSFVIFITVATLRIVCLKFFLSGTACAVRTIVTRCVLTRIQVLACTYIRTRGEWWCICTRQDRWCACIIHPCMLCDVGSSCMSGACVKYC